MALALSSQMPPPAPQWIAIPTKSVSALARAAVPNGPRSRPAPRSTPASPAEDLRHVAVGARAGVLEHDVRARDRAEVAAGAGVGHPRGRRRSGLARVAVDHVRQPSAGGVPSESTRSVQYLKADAEGARAVVLEVAVGVGDRLAVAIGVEAREGAEDAARGVRDEDRVVVREGALLAHEAQQVRHLLEVGRELRPIAEQVRVVELQVDDVLDLVVDRVQLAAGRSERS